MINKTTNFTLSALMICLFCFIFWNCSEKHDSAQNEVPTVVTTTTHLGDAIQNVGGQQVHVVSLMGPGVDPHLYKASEGDVSRLTKADAIIYHGIHLEGKMAQILENLSKKRPHVYSVEKCLEGVELIDSPDYAGNNDPHVWFDIGLWKSVIECSSNWLSELIPGDKEKFQENADAYLKRLDSLSEKTRQQIATIPEDRRVLITAHDAFAYFGKSFGLEVRGLLGLSTADEAGVKDIQKLADFIVERRIPAIFVESSIPTRYLEALQEAVASRDFSVKIGGELYSDALGSHNTPEGTYIGMFEHNVSTIVSALTPNDPEQVSHE